jgi:class 3 adenylate cyclase/tetratricopeptide (TPR) repeat protein
MDACPGCGAHVLRDTEVCPECRRPLREALEQHKLVTVIFCDVVDSSGMTERLGELATHRVMTRFSQKVGKVLAGHGGTVGNRRGDGMMTVFGIPAMHDDDALRAVRAAAELREEMAELRADLARQHEDLLLRVRLGVNSGSVLVSGGTALEEEVTGPTANLAKRLEELADPDGILIGADTYKLVRDAVRAEQVQVEVKTGGTTRSVAAYRVLQVLPGKPGRIRRVDGPMIGRTIEQQLLHHLFERTVAESSCHLVTVLGPAGVGKSRLVEEFVRQVGGRATVLRGHCLSYGDSVTFWPIVEIVHQAAGIAPTDPPERVQERLAALVSDEDQAERIDVRVAQLLGSNDESELPGDTASALRWLLEVLARRQSLLVLVEDLQWAEPTLLETIEHIAERALDTPIMIVGMGRPDELLRRNRHWPSGKLNATSILLSPLSDSEAEQLVTNLLDNQPLHPDAHAQIISRAQGNPLIIEELTDALVGDGVLRQLEGHWILTRDLDMVSLPLSIQALLEVRLERLDTEERAILERAAVVGEQFHAGDIKALVSGSMAEQISDLLDQLIRQELIRRDHDAAVPLPAESGEGYRFRHILIRTVAYEGMSEELRAILHERYSDWLERTASERLSQFDELIGYHLSKAVDYLTEIGSQEEHRRGLARRAGMRFAAAGRRAAIRGDIRPTATWLERATRLLPPEDPARLDVLPDLAEALQASGRLDQAVKVYEELISAANAAGEEGRLKHAILGKLYVTAFRDLGSFLRNGPDEVQRAIPVFERQSDQLGLAKAFYLLAYADWAMGHSQAAAPAALRARDHARNAGDKRWEAHILRLHCLILFWGPTPIDEVVEHTKEACRLARSVGMRSLEATALTILARAAAMRDDFRDARRLSAEANAITNTLGELLTRATDSISEGLIELLDEKLNDAEQVLRNGYEALKEMGGTGPGASVAAMLARVYLQRRRYADAERMALECKRTAADEQLDAQIKWRSIYAIVLARRGDLTEAEPLAREALRRAVQTDQLESRAEAHADLAEALRFAERREEAAQEFQQALTLYEQKGNHFLAKRLRRELLSLRR